MILKEDCSEDDFIDVIEGNRVYMPCLHVFNKIDKVSREELGAPLSLSSPTLSLSSPTLSLCLAPLSLSV